MIETLLALEVLGVKAEEVGGFLHFAQRFHAVLADLQGQCRADQVDALLDQRRHPLEQAHALGERCSAPGREGRVRRFHRLRGLRRVGHGEAAQHPALVDRTMP